MKNQLHGWLRLCALTLAPASVFAAGSSCIVSGSTDRAPASSAWSEPMDLDAPTASLAPLGDFDSVLTDDDWGVIMRFSSCPPVGAYMIIR